jgi:hypothetical protein
VRKDVRPLVFKGFNKDGLRTQVEVNANDVDIIEPMLQGTSYRFVKGQDHYMNNKSTGVLTCLAPAATAQSWFPPVDPLGLEELRIARHQSKKARATSRSATVYPPSATTDPEHRHYRPWLDATRTLDLDAAKRAEEIGLAVQQSRQRVGG